MITRTHFAALAIAGLAASTSSAALAQSGVATSVDAVAAEAAGASFDYTAGQAPQPIQTAQNVATTGANAAMDALPELPPAPVMATSMAQTAAQSAAATTAAAHNATSHMPVNYPTTTSYPAQATYQAGAAPVAHHSAPVVHQNAVPVQTIPVQFDRHAWLHECYRRTGGKSQKERGGIIGGVAISEV